jgi:heme-degrading monooxygenase HmoA
MSADVGGFVIAWEFEVAPGRAAAFREVYGPGGDWAALFRRAPGYLGTMLLADQARADRFVTIDRWIDEASYHAFRARFAEEYAALDEACEALSTAERELGAFVACDATMADLA